MHDCPRCKVPLHGYEKKCPSCKTPQIIEEQYIGFEERFKEPKDNNLIIIILVGLVLFVGLGFFVIKYTWIGQILEAPKQQVVLTTEQIRQNVLNQIKTDFDQMGVTSTTKIICNNKETTLNCPEPIVISIEAKLKDKSQKDTIFNNLKGLLINSKIASIKIKDIKTKAIWTFDITQTDSNSDEDSQPKTQDNSEQN